METTPEGVELVDKAIPLVPLVPVVVPETVEVPQAVLYVENEIVGTIDATEDGVVEILPDPELSSRPSDAVAFIGWYEDTAQEPFLAGTEIDEDVSLFARFFFAQTLTDFFVTLYVDNATYGDPILVENGNISEPLPPIEISGKGSFLGWYTEKDGGSLFDVSASITESISLYAKFSDNTYTISFKDDKGVIFHDYEVTKTDLVVKTDRTFAYPIGQTFAGWKLEGDSEAFIFGKTTDKNLTFIPFFENAYYVYFHTEGSLIDPAVVSHGGALSSPTEPTRTGYEFLRWSATENGSENYDFSTPLTKNLELYAVWKGLPVNYTVVCWLEKANIVGREPSFPDDFMSVKVSTATADAGSIVSYNNVHANNKLTGSELSYFNKTPGFTGTTVLGNGLSVVNLYYKRAIYTHSFYSNFAENKPSRSRHVEWKWRNENLNIEQTKNPVQYTTEFIRIVYKFEAKYEQDISNLWPSNGYNIDITFYLGTEKAKVYFDNWYKGNSDSKMSTKRLTMDTDLLPKPTSSNLEIDWQMGIAETLEVKELNYWIEALSGESGVPSEGVPGAAGSYIKSDDYSQTLYVTGNVVPKNISGLTNKGKKETAITDGKKYDFYYDRNTLTISYRTNGGESIADNSAVKHGEKMSEFKPKVDPEKSNALFKGWYYDSEFKNAVSWDKDRVNTSKINVASNGAVTTTPINEMILFAKWEATDHKINFYDRRLNLGKPQGLLTVQNVGINQFASDPVASIKVGTESYLLTSGTPVPGYGKFAGWYWYSPAKKDIMFSFEIPINNTYDLYAGWDTQGFTVKYLSGDNVTGLPPVDKALYGIGTSAYILGNSNLSNSGLVFVGWKDKYGTIYYKGNKVKITGDLELTAHFMPKNEICELTYSDGYSGGSTNITISVAINKTVQLNDSTTFVRAGYKLIGWHSDNLKYAFGEKYYFTKATTFTAIWEQTLLTVNFNSDSNGSLNGVANFTAVPINSKFSENVTVPTPIPLTGYYFAGWSPELPSPTSLVTTDLEYVATFALQPVVVPPPAPTPEPEPEPEPVPSPTPSPSPSPRPTTRPTPTPSPVVTPSPAPSQTPAVVAPTTTPTATPTTNPDAAQNTDAPTTDSPATPPTNGPVAQVVSTIVDSVKTVIDDIVTLITDGQVALSGGFRSSGAWALVNLILAILTTLSTVVLWIGYFIGKKNKKDENENIDENQWTASASTNSENKKRLKRKGIARILSIIPTFLAILVFIITENITLPMVFTDRWTLLMAVIALVQVVVILLSKKSKKEPIL